MPETLKLRRVAIDTYRENVAYLHRDCGIYRSEGFQALSKVEILLEGGAKPVLARLAGAPMDQGAGVDLLRKLGDPVQQGEALYAIYAEFPADFRFARAMAGQSSGYAIGELLPR